MKVKTLFNALLYSDIEIVEIYDTEQNMGLILTLSVERFRDEYWNTWIKKFDIYEGETVKVLAVILS